MKRSIGFRADLSFFTFGNGGRDAGLKLHQSDLAWVFAAAVSGVAADGAPVLRFVQLPAKAFCPGLVEQPERHASIQVHFNRHHVEADVTDGARQS